MRRYASWLAPGEMHSLVPPRPLHPFTNTLGGWRRQSLEGIGRARSAVLGPGRGGVLLGRRPPPCAPGPQAPTGQTQVQIELHPAGSFFENPGMAFPSQGWSCMGWSPPSWQRPDLTHPRTCDSPLTWPNRTRERSPAYVQARLGVRAGARRQNPSSGPWPPVHQASRSAQKR